MRSLSRTLIVGTTLGTASVLVASGIVLYLLVRTSLFAQFDHALLDKASLLASTVEEEKGTLDLEFTDLDMGEFEGEAAVACLQLWLSDGATLFKSPAVGQSDLTAGQMAPDGSKCCFVRLPDGGRGRAVYLRFLPRQEHEGRDGETGEHQGATADAQAAPVSLVLVRGTREIDQVLGTMRLLLLLVGAGASSRQSAMMSSSLASL